MTEENARKLFKHYTNVGLNDRAQEILDAYPHFAEEEKVTKSKGKK